MIPAGLTRVLETSLSGLLGMKVRIIQVLPVRGGDINSCFRLDAGNLLFFLKIIPADQYPDLLKKEFRGLELLRQQRAVAIPEPLITGKTGQYAWLVTEWVETGSPARGFWNDFAGSLARLHHCSRQDYGLEEDNYIGTIPQSNRARGTWAEFYREERLMPLLRKALTRDLLDKKDLDLSENLFSRLTGIFPGERPSLLHGDLWAGNFLVAGNGKACCFDPAVYFGHREMDLAMARLFGGFDNSFFIFYDQHFPLAPGWKERIGICQLYPLLVHLLLFGRSYLPAIRDILCRF